MTIKQISVQDANAIITNDNNAVYIDARTTGEFAQGHPPGSINIPAFVYKPEIGGIAPDMENFKKVVDEKFGTTKTLIIGCAKGGRSQAACEYLQGQGYDQLSNVSGGFSAWLAAGLPIEK